MTLEVFSDILSGGITSLSFKGAIMESNFDLSLEGITAKKVLRNAPPAKLYEEALRNETGSAISNTGALMVYSGEKTGRSPKDKRIVENPESAKDIWWGDVNIPLDHHTFKINRERAIDYLNTCPQIYVVDGYAGWEPENRLKVRVICSRAYHALFMHNMLIRPTQRELENFGKPDFTIYNSGEFPANRYTKGISSKTSVAVSFEDKQLVILGTEYAGEMKKGVFTIMNYLMPKKNVLSMHCSANVGKDNSVSLFFGLSGTGKTTLSADPQRKLIGDDEHGWSEKGIFNVEGGCYAKCIELSAEKEPEIFQAIRFGTVLENVVYDPMQRVVDFDNKSITENTRASYPIEYIPQIAMPCVGGHPKNIVFLTCDAFGVLPPVSRLSPEQAMYHFISGYTAKVAGTEMGVTEPQATFSACFGAAFMVWHPTKYAELLSQKIQKHGSQAWLVNTGWSGGGYGKGSRLSLKFTRAIIDAINNGELLKIETHKDKLFGFEIPTACPGVPSEILNPRNTWEDKAAYDATARKLADLFKNNFKKYETSGSKKISDAGPA
jgi:phosphoenolpyruvate carboxykinase (ATP)